MGECFGIVGGLGPKATVHFLNHIVARTAAKRDQDHPQFILLQHPQIPDRTDYILDPSKPNPLPYLLKDVQSLSEAGVSFIVIPCNTAHYFFDQLQDSCSVPIINMIRETVRYITTHFSADKKIGLLGTPGTLRSNLYQKELLEAGLTPVLPTEAIQNKVNALIFRQVKQGHCVDYRTYLDVLKNMYALGCHQLILGCTELSTIEDEADAHDFPLVDAQAVLAERSIQRAGKRVKRLYADEIRRFVPESTAQS